MTLTSVALQLLQLWEKNGYFDEETIQQLQNPALGLGQYQVSGAALFSCDLTVHKNRVMTITIKVSV